MLKQIKRSGLGALRATGVLRGFEQSRWRRERLVILGYHGIALEDEHEWDPTLYLSAAEFEGRLKILKQRDYAVLPLAEAVERLYRRDLPPRAAALTFDDGSYDFRERAWPLLHEYGFPSTVYLTTFYCYYNRPVFNTACAYLLWRGRGKAIGARPLGLKETFHLTTPVGREHARQRLFALAATLQMDADAKDALLRSLAGMVGVDYDAMLARRMLHLMSPDEVIELSAAEVDFELHTHRHRTPLDEGLFRREIRDNRIRLRALTGRTPRHFCYPSGVYHREFLPWLEAEEVEFATTCEPNLASPRSDRLLLPRFLDHGNLSAIEFESAIAGPALLLPNRGGAAPPRLVTPLSPSQVVGRPASSGPEPARGARAPGT